MKPKLLVFVLLAGFAVFLHGFFLAPTLQGNTDLKERNSTKLENDPIPATDPKVYYSPTSPDTCGDATTDGSVDIADMLYLIDYVARGGPSPICNPITVCGDPNGDGWVDGGDVLYLADYIFYGGPAPIGFPLDCTSPHPSDTLDVDTGTQDTLKIGVVTAWIGQDIDIPISCYNDDSLLGFAVGLKVDDTAHVTLDSVSWLNSEVESWNVRVYDLTEDSVIIFASRLIEQPMPPGTNLLATLWAHVESPGPPGGLVTLDTCYWNTARPPRFYTKTANYFGYVPWVQQDTLEFCPEEPNDLGHCDTASFHIGPMVSADTNEVDARFGFASFPIYYSIDDSVNTMSMAFQVTASCPISIDSVSFANSSPAIQNIGSKLVTIFSPDSLVIAIIALTEPCIPPNMPNPEIAAEIFISFDPADTCCYIQIDTTTVNLMSVSDVSFHRCRGVGEPYYPRFYPKVAHLYREPYEEGVEVTAGLDQSAEKQDSVFVPFYVHNVGDITTTYDLEVSDSLGWNISLSDSEITLDVDETDTVEAKVYIPDVPGGTKDKITLVATSQTDPFAKDSAYAYVTCVEYNLIITKIEDVGNDQGKQVSIEWLSFIQSDPPVKQFEIYRRIDELLGSNPSGKFEGVLYPPGDWHFVTTVPAHSETLYATVVPTLKDSTPVEGMHYSVFFIRAATDDPYIFHDSPVDSGYSVDNLAPSAPTGLFVVNLDGALELAWNSCEAEDFDYFAVYRDTLSGFTPAAPLYYTTDTTVIDNSCVQGKTYYYVVSAFDFSGNQGAYSDEVSGSLEAAICGDINADGNCDFTDILYLIDYIFKGGEPPQCNPWTACADVNHDESIVFTDILYLIDYVFKAGPPPVGYPGPCGS